MFKEYRKEIEWGGRPLILETGKIARQADGAVMATYGDTKVLCTVVGETSPRPGLDFFPLAVHYQEKTFAAGKIPGGFFKREGRPSEKETLTSRLIDRPIRPLFAKGFSNETQVICTVLTHDLENDPDIVARVGTSAALTISGLPFMGPIGGARVGHINGEYILNPPLDEMPNTDLNLVVAGTRDGVLMVESEASQLSEEVMLGAVMFGHQGMQPVIDAIIELAEACAKEPREVPKEPEGKAALAERVKTSVEADLRAAYKETAKTARLEKLNAARDRVRKELTADQSLDEGLVADTLGDILKALEKDIVRKDILKTGQRIDSRDTKTVRQISVEVGSLPRTHGSALFTRGETQAIVVTTLGTGQDEQIIDGLAEDYREHFMLHYNFPPYSVGEAGRFGFTGRREVGHGKLAWRAIRPLMPSKEDFPYTIRVVSEITESNGSSSMATVCGASLSLMDAGVPLAKPVAGIAGTEDGITSLQMDIKITSITEEIMKVALAQARDGRLHILDEMAKGLGAARQDISENAPRITMIKIPKDKIREVIGPGGKMIREICEVTGTKIDLDDDGTVKVAAVDQKATEVAIEWIRNITAEPEIGAIYTGKVVKTVDFGAFVNFMGSKDGLVHISELAPERVGKTTDIINVGDEVRVKLIGIDDRGKVKLSLKAVDQETGKEISGQSSGRRAAR